MCLWYEFDNDLLKIASKLPWDQWANNLFYSVQFRYGSRWGPRHPKDTQIGQMEEFILDEGELLTRVSAWQGWIMDSLEFTTNRKTFPAVGTTGTGTSELITISLEEMEYFAGAVVDHYGERVSQLIALPSSCLGQNAMHFLMTWFLFRLTVVPWVSIIFTTNLGKLNRT